MRKMKESGINYCGEIPAHWDVLPNKYIFVLKKTIVDNPDNWQLLSLTTKGIKTKNDGDTTGKVPENYFGYQTVEPGDLVMCLFDLDVSAVFSGYSELKGMISPAYKVYKPKNNEIDNKYMNYWFSYVFSGRHYKQFSKSLRFTVNSDEFGKQLSILPPIDEQKKIVEYLDAKCQKIEKIVVDIQTQIDLLNDYKKSIIFETVTRGLNKNVHFVDSGMKWIGEIPEHWRLEKIKYNFLRHETRNPGGKTILSVYREYGVIPKDSRDDNHNVTSEDTSKYKYVKPGYLAINKMKAWQGSMGVSDYEGVVSPAYFIYVFTNNNFNKKYAHYLLRGCYKDELRRISGGIRDGQWDLDPYLFENTLIPIPPIDEQNKIVQFLDTISCNIESVVEEKQKQIEILEGYKNSIIYEYVTGKKEVPNE